MGIINIENFYITLMKHFVIISLFFCLIGCIEEYSDSIKINQDGSAVFYASIYPFEPDSVSLGNIKEHYDNIPGLRFDSAWFLKRDSLHSLIFKLYFEDLIHWHDNRKFETDFIGSISLTKTGASKYTFERVINLASEGESGTIVPEESAFILGLISGNDSAYWNYSIILPQGAVLTSSEPIDETFVKQEKENVLSWKIPAREAVLKRIALKAEFSTSAKKQIQLSSVISIVASVVVMLLAIALLVRKLKKLGSTLNELKTEEKSLSGD